MAEEHVFDRITKAQAAEQKAVVKANELVDQFRKAANLLGTWRKVSFVWRDDNGVPCGPMSSERDEYTITISDVPNLAEIRDAIAKWQEASRIVTCLLDALTAEQRQTLRLPPR